ELLQLLVCVESHHRIFGALADGRVFASRQSRSRQVDALEKRLGEVRMFPENRAAPGRSVRNRRLSP
ncbi:MAG: hypothetical protein WB420_03210, partial [Bradyrhizobium sp.]